MRDNADGRIWDCSLAACDFANQSMERVEEESILLAWLSLSSVQATT